MENKGFYNKFESLPSEAQQQVIAFIDFLKNKYNPKRKKILGRKRLSDKKFVGIWKDRDEMSDSSKWVRNLRKKEWNEQSE